MSTKSATDLPGEDPQSFKRIIIPLITLILGCFMVLLDGSAVNVALPKLSGAFGASLSSLQWVITAYVLATAAVIPWPDGCPTNSAPSEFFCTPSPSSPSGPSSVPWQRTLPC